MAETNPPDAVIHASGQATPIAKNDMSLPSRSDIATRCLSRLRKEDYCVIRGLRNSGRCEDVDLYLNPATATNALDEIFRAITHNSGVVISELSDVSVLQFGVLFPDVALGIRFDTFQYFGTNGIEILPANFVLPRCVEVDGVVRMGDSDEAILAFLKEVVGAGRTRATYLKKAVVAFSHGNRDYEPVLRAAFGEGCYTRTVRPLLLGEEMDLRVASRAMRRSARRNWRLMHRNSAALHKVMRLMFPPGAIIAFELGESDERKEIIADCQARLAGASHLPVDMVPCWPGVAPDAGGTPWTSKKPHSAYSCDSAPAMAKTEVGARLHPPPLVGYLRSLIGVRARTMKEMHLFFVREARLRNDNLGLVFASNWRSWLLAVQRLLLPHPRVVVSISSPGAQGGEDDMRHEIDVSVRDGQEATELKADTERRGQDVQRERHVRAALRQVAEQMRGHRNTKHKVLKALWRWGLK